MTSLNRKAIRLVIKVSVHNLSRYRSRYYGDEMHGHSIKEMLVNESVLQQGVMGIFNDINTERLLP
jgi:hypothetical protein